VDFEYGQELRDRHHAMAAARQMQELDVSATEPNAEVFGDHDANARAVDVGHVVEVEDDLDAPPAEEVVDPLAERNLPFLEHHAASKVQDGDVADLTFGDLQHLSAR